MYNASITGSSVYYPEFVLKNDTLVELFLTSTFREIIAKDKKLERKDLSDKELLDYADNWIIDRCGVKERRVAAEHESIVTMGANALSNLSNLNSIEMILVGTNCSKLGFFSLAGGINKGLIEGYDTANKNYPLNSAGIFDFQSNDSFNDALIIAKALIKEGTSNKVLVVYSKEKRIAKAKIIEKDSLDTLVTQLTPSLILPRSIWDDERSNFENDFFLEHEKNKKLIKNGLEAAKCEIDSKRTDPKTIDLIIFTSDYYPMAIKSTGHAIQNYIYNKLGIQTPKNLISAEIQAGCPGPNYGIAILSALIKTGIINNGVYVGVEKFIGKENGKFFISIMDPCDINTAILFGDIAGALKIERTEKKGILANYLGGDGYNREAILYKEVSGRVNMNGKAVMKFAGRAVADAIEKAYVKAEVNIKDTSAFILHQANIRITEKVIEIFNRKYGISNDRFPSNIQNYGNTSAATQVTLLHELTELKKLKKGDLIAFGGMGSGLTKGANIVIYH